MYTRGRIDRHTEPRLPTAAGGGFERTVGRKVAATGRGSGSSVVLDAPAAETLWQSLQRHAAHRQPARPSAAAPVSQVGTTGSANQRTIRQHRQRDPTARAPIYSEGSAPALDMGWEEAAAAGLMFEHLLPEEQGSATAPAIAELASHPAAPRLLAALRRLWRAHASAGAPSEGDHCSAAGGSELLRAVTAAASELGAASCAASAASSATLDAKDGAAAAAAGAWATLPYALLRRAALVTLQLVQQHGTEGSAGGKSAAHEACQEAVSQAMPPLLLAFASAFNCSRAVRPAMELFHVSKSGGTSMCQLAAAAGLHNPMFNIAGNCLIPGFGDEPRWSRVEGFMTASNGQRRNSAFWPAVSCDAWVAEKEHRSCAARAPLLHSKGINFYANELTLHGGEDGKLGSAAPCPQIETVMVLRDPAERARSHVVEVEKVYNSFASRDRRFTRSRDLNTWQAWAPAVLDNYMTRSLLGRQYMCRDFGTIGQPELTAAARTLATLDHVLVLEEGGLTDVAMRAGMGWSSSLKSKHWRWAINQDLHADLGFGANSMELLRQWNLLDKELYTWAQLLLRVDAAFHTAVAVLSGKVEGPACKGRPAAANAAASGSAEAGRAAAKTSEPVKDEGSQGAPSSSNQQQKQQQHPDAAVGAAAGGSRALLSSHLAAAHNVRMTKRPDGRALATASAAAARSGMLGLSSNSKFQMYGYYFVQEVETSKQGGVAAAAAAVLQPALPLHPELLPAGLGTAPAAAEALAACSAQPAGARFQGGGLLALLTGDTGGNATGLVFRLPLYVATRSDVALNFHGGVV